jgi:DNA (cytosine-5)-methyltransferase 1
VINGLDLFSGIGGITVALGEYVRPVAYCESDLHSQGILLSRMADGGIPQAPIWPDVRTLLGESLPVPIDIVYGGFPCQGISSAGSGRGLEDERSGLVFEIFRLVDEVTPVFVFLENVPPIRTRGAETVGKELARRGYDCRWCLVSAAEVGAPHRRNRWFLLASHGEKSLADSSRVGQPILSETHNDDGEISSRDVADGRCANVADSDGERLEKRIEGETGKFETSLRGDWWTVEPDVGRVAHGVPSRVDRLRGLGNSVVPLQARTAFKTLMGIK